MNVCISFLCLELNAQLKRELNARVQREQEGPQNAGSLMLDVHPPRETTRHLLLIEEEDVTSNECL